MSQTTDRIADEFAKFLTDAAGLAQGVKREADTFVKTQAERFLKDLDLPSREEFEAVREMAVKAREENEALKARLDALEASLATAAKTKKGEK
ncbi:accessory factor UbiK family protein [Phreatobacter aquaticus]|uniref:Accessory factor UbiK family protein n=1 Tax=Phreatobacter aquaticus TaxID=2570229 RepID=A0A4D7QD36_9HYPH|nr:accessory factor UbiK family protein [Phreatobacter aquaticus]QCK84311.1 accessory factor UbiK family protein [Phreatobacter aquaticus]